MKKTAVLVLLLSMVATMGYSVPTNATTDIVPTADEGATPLSGDSADPSPAEDTAPVVPVEIKPAVTPAVVKPTETKVKVAGLRDGKAALGSVDVTKLTSRKEVPDYETCKPRQGARKCTKTSACVDTALALLPVDYKCIPQKAKGGEKCGSRKTPQKCEEGFKCEEKGYFASLFADRLCVKA
jgi:hypothetical protein